MSTVWVLVYDGFDYFVLLDCQSVIDLVSCLCFFVDVETYCVHHFPFLYDVDDLHNIFRAYYCVLIFYEVLG